MVGKFPIIGITTPNPWSSPEEEASAILRLMGEKSDARSIRSSISSYHQIPIDIFHLRKPLVPQKYILSLLRHIPESMYSRIVVHFSGDSEAIPHSLGVHLTGYRSYSPNQIKELTGDRIVSRSCHKLSEFDDSTLSSYFTYSFLSPVFDSVSKPGYNSNFSLDDAVLRSYADKFKIIALGGVVPEKFDKLFNSKFAGAALLGYLWSPKSPLEDKIDNLLYYKQKFL